MSERLDEAALEEARQFLGIRRTRRRDRTRSFEPRGRRPIRRVEGDDLEQRAHLRRVAQALERLLDLARALRVEVGETLGAGGDAEPLQPFALGDDAA